MLGSLLQLNSQESSTLATSSPEGARCGASALPGRREQSIEAAEETGVWPVRRRRGLRTGNDVLKSFSAPIFVSGGNGAVAGARGV